MTPKFTPSSKTTTAAGYTVKVLGVTKSNSHAHKIF